MSNSISVVIAPCDKRCRFWAKIIRKETALPIPCEVDGANDIPGGYARNGDEELFEGDVMIVGEEVSHRRSRGWNYEMVYMGKDGEQVTLRPTSEIKATLKRNGIESSLLAGAGDVAAIVRIIHALRSGISLV